MKFEVGKFNPCLCKHASIDIRLFYHGDDVVILADENEALVVNVRGVLGGDEGDLKEITLLNRAMRCRKVGHSWWCHSVASGNHHGNARSATCRSHQDTE